MTTLSPILEMQTTFSSKSSIQYLGTGTGTGKRIEFARIEGRGLTVICGDFEGFSAEGLMPSSAWGHSLLVPDVWKALKDFGETDVSIDLVIIPLDEAEV